MTAARIEAPFRAAQPDDAALLAEVINAAGEGLPYYLWQSMAEPDQSPWEVGRRRALREEGAFSYKNAFIVEDGGHAAGALIGYVIPEQPEPIGEDTPALFRPLLELEALAPGTWYVNVLGVLPDHRNRGLGGKLLALAESLGRDAGVRGMSVIVSDANPGARRLYERTGYAVAGERPKVKEGWRTPGTAWILMTKALPDDPAA